MLLVTDYNTKSMFNVLNKLANITCDVVYYRGLHDQYLPARCSYNDDRYSFYVKYLLLVTQVDTDGACITGVTNDWHTDSHV